MNITSIDVTDIIFCTTELSIWESRTPHGQSLEYTTQYTFTALFHQVTV